MPFQGIGEPHSLHVILASIVLFHSYTLIKLYNKRFPQRLTFYGYIKNRKKEGKVTVALRFRIFGKSNIALRACLQAALC